MKSFRMAVLAVFVIAATAFAQGKPIHLLTKDERQKAQDLQGKIQQSLSQDHDYAKALPLLVAQRKIFEAALGRVESGKTPVGDHKKAAEAFLNSRIGTDLYNEACCLSMTGKKAEAIERLRKSFEKVPADLDHMQHDTDLDPIRDDPAYKALIASLDYNDVLVTYAPKGVTDKMPLVVLLPDRGASEKDLLDQFKKVADTKKLGIAAPRPPVTIAPGRYGWSHLSDEESALKKIGYAIEKAEGDLSVDPTKVYLVGEGLGGKFAILYALMHPGSVKGVVSVNSFWNKYYYADFLPKAKAAGLSVCLIQSKGQHYEKAEEGVKQLTKAGVKAELVTSEGDAKVPADVVEKVSGALDWFTK